MKIGIIGGGFTGLTAARDLLLAHHEVTLFEGAPQVGGLASGIKAATWEWYVERFYHHIFTTDRAIIDLAEAIGASKMVFFNAQVTAFFCAEHGSHPVSVGGILANPHLPFIDRVRYGASALLLKMRRDWPTLEQQTAAVLLRRWAGKRVYTQMWEPLLVSKFGPYAEEVNAAWIWARLKARSFKLGYFRGGFQAFADAVAGNIEEQLGGTVRLHCPVQQLCKVDDGWCIRTREGEQRFDRVVIAAAPSVLLKLLPQLPSDYTAKLLGLKSMGAVVMVAALSEQLLVNGEYWFMPPKSDFPYLNIVEHTNMIDRRYYGGDRVIYLGDYMPADHRYFTMDTKQLTAEWLAPLNGINAAFRMDWVKQTWLFREPYAQPVVPINHGANVPAIKTPLDGVYWASLSHVYPWDRGTNFAVDLGHQVAAELLQST